MVEALVMEALGQESVKRKEKAKKLEEEEEEVNPAVNG